MILLSDILNPFVADGARCADRVAHKPDYTVLIRQTDISKKAVARTIERIQSKQADVLIQFSAHMRKKLIDEKNPIPFVNLCGGLPDAKFPAVQFEDHFAEKKLPAILFY